MHRFLRQHGSSILASYIQSLNSRFSLEAPFSGDWMHIRETYRGRFLFGPTNLVQEKGSRLSEEINSRIVTLTLDALDKDHECEQFFASIPGFCSSKVARYSKRVFAELDSKLTWTLYRFLHRTLSSGFLLEADKKRRVIICVKAVDIVCLSLQL
jgi:hypothetical protein